MTDQKPPSDEAMGKVIAKQHNMDSPPIIYEERAGQGCFVWLYKGGHKTTKPDPRTNTDAALELERWVEMNAPYRCEPDETHETYTWWKFQHADGTSDSIEIPVSGQGRRTAVCNLAVKVMGVK